MSEKYKSRESIPKPKRFQVVLVPYMDGPRRCVVTQLFDTPDSVGTSEIRDEGTDTERLVVSGSSDTATMILTDEIWDRARVIDAYTVNFEAVIANAREAVERIMFPEEG
jgi:hypothetical protein